MSSRMRRAGLAVSRALSWVEPEARRGLGPAGRELVERLVEIYSGRMGGSRLYRAVSGAVREAWAIAEMAERHSRERGYELELGAINPYGERAVHILYALPLSFQRLKLDPFVMAEVSGVLGDEKAVPRLLDGAASTLQAYPGELSITEKPWYYLIQSHLCLSRSGLLGEFIEALGGDLGDPRACGSGLMPEPVSVLMMIWLDGELVELMDSISTPEQMRAGISGLMERFSRICARCGHCIGGIFLSLELLVSRMLSPPRCPLRSSGPTSSASP